MKRLDATILGRWADTSPLLLIFIVYCLSFSLIVSSCDYEKSRLEKALKTYHRLYERDEKPSPDLLLEIQISALNDDDSSVQSAAIEALGKLGDNELLPSLINTLGHDDWMIRRDAVEALGNLGDKAAVPHLISVLNSEDDVLNRWARERAAEALGKLGDNSAVPHLINTLNSEDDLFDWGARQRAAEALGELGDSGAVPCSDRGSQPWR